jgi:hypothetical protein
VVRFPPTLPGADLLDEMLTRGERVLGDAFAAGFTTETLSPGVADHRTREITELKQRKICV